MKKKIGEYRNLELKDNGWSFEVKTKDGWVSLGGLSVEVSKTEAESFAQNTANGWVKK